jgi:hypothetical protein
MRETEPIPQTQAARVETVAMPDARDAFGLAERSDRNEFAAQVYTAKFELKSGDPGYAGYIYILQADAPTDNRPMLLRRDKDNALTMAS